MKTHLIPVGAVAAQIVLAPHIRRIMHGHTMPAPFIPAVHKFDRVETLHSPAHPGFPSSPALPARLAPALTPPASLAKRPPKGSVGPCYDDRAIFRAVVSAVVWG